MGSFFCCLGGDQDATDVLTPDPDERRRQMLEAAERRKADAKSRGIKDPESVERRKKRQEETEKAATIVDSGNTLRWNVFTVNAESRSIIVSNVHATGLANDLVKTFTKFGTIVQCDELLDYPKEPFTQMFLLKFEDIQSARRAKKKADEMYFFGSILHVFYAPEYETVNDTREKLMQRRSNVVQRVKFLAKEGKRATKGGNTPNTVGMLNDEHVSEPNAAGVYMRLSSSNIRREITPALPHIRPPEVKKRHHSQANMSHNCATKASVSSTCGQGWIPPRKVPKMMRLPGYVPPKSASLPS